MTRKILLAAACSILLGAVSPTARAGDIVDTVLDVLVTAGVVDSAFIEAKSAIQCLVNANGVTDSSLQTCSEQAAGPKVKGLIQSDAKLKVIVNTALAVRDHQWPTVLELVGTDGMKTIVCTVVPGGAVRDLFCGAVFQLAKPVIKPTLHAVVSGDWLGLITLLGPKAACSVIPGGDVKDALCGPLAELLNGVKELAEYAVGPLKVGADFVIETWKNEDDPVPLASYYQSWFVPYYQCGSWLQLVPPKDRGDWGFKCGWATEHLYSNCVTYFDNHKMSGSDAANVCKKMQGTFQQHVKGFAQALQAAPSTYYHGIIEPELFLQFINFKRWGNLQAVNNSITQACQAHLYKLYPVPGPPDQNQWPQPQLWHYLCRSIGAQTVSALQSQQASLEQDYAKLKQLSCSPKYGPQIPFTCASYSGLQLCQQLMGDTPKQNCLLDQAKADTQLAALVAGELGKRCKASGKTVACSRPWKHSQCNKRVAEYGDMAGSKPTVKCFANLLGFNIQLQKAKTILDALNEVITAPLVNTGSGKAGSIKMALSPGCEASWDPLALICADAKAITTLPTKLPKINLDKCPPDPGHDGADQPCYAGPWPAGMANTALQANTSAAVPPATGANVPAAAAGGFAVPINPVTSARTTTASRSLAPADKADLTSINSVVIGGRTIPWGSRVAIDGATGSRTRDGLCRFPLRYTLINRGTVATSAFVNQLHINANRVQPTHREKPMNPRESRVVTDSIAIQAGGNPITLLIDSSGLISESNENNNRFHLSIELHGTCGLRNRSIPPAQPAVRPATRSTGSTTQRPSAETAGRITLPSRESNR